MEKILVIGIGNIGRADDGLGWAFLDKISGDERFEIHYRYQLQIEDAELISRHQKIWFVDASHQEYENGYKAMEVKPKRQLSYTSHALPPSAILQLCHEIYDSYPSAYLLGISGKDWGLRNGMSGLAEKRLKLAVHHFMEIVVNEKQLSEVTG